MIFTENIWKEWSAQVEKDSEPKKYIHFDHPFAFQSKREILKRLFENPGTISKHPFLPLIKMVVKTPRYKYQETENKYALETKERPILFASHFDTFIYSYYAFALGDKYQKLIVERGFSDCVLAYRTDLNGKCNIQFAKEVFDKIREKGECAVLALDIKGYFDSIDHAILKKTWSEVLGSSLDDDDYSVFKSLTKYSYVNQVSFLKHFDFRVRGKNAKRPISYSTLLDGKSQSEKLNKVRDANLIVPNKAFRLADGKKFNYGVPQGSALSALLSNIYLLNFDEFMFQWGQREGFIYRRYCDDILIICNTSDAVKIQTETINKIKDDYFLTIQNQKVELIEFRKNSKGQLRAFNLVKLLKENMNKNLTGANEKIFYKSLQYLGFEFNGQKILIRNSSLSRYFRKMRARIVKSVGMAYGKSGHSDKVFRQQIFHRYTHLGRRNFLHYAYHASERYYKVRKGLREGMDSPAIKRQLSRHFDVVLKSLEMKNRKRFLYKIHSDANTKMKKVR